MEQNQFQRVRFDDEIVQINTILIRGIECLRLEDVQRRFPTVVALSIDNIQLTFLTDEDGRNLEPLRVKVYREKIIDGIALKTPSEVISHDQLNRIEGKIDRIDANTQELLMQMRYIMTQMYELHEYTTPRYFFILPAKHHDWDMMDAVQNWFHLHYKLYFLCECSDDPKELHIAPHDGYSVKKLSEFIARYGPYLLTTLNAVKVLLSLGGFVIPQLANVSTVVGNVLPRSLQSTDNFLTIKKQINIAQTFLDKPETKLIYASSSLIERDRPQTVPIQGADLRELESYLDRIDSTRSLGNLYRIVTYDGHVRWVCQQHYDAISFNKKINDCIIQIETMGGKFNRENKEISFNQLKLTNSNVKILLEILTQGFNVSKFVFNNCSISENNFQMLIDIIINRSPIDCFQVFNFDIRNAFGLTKYICNYIQIHLSNHLISVSFNEYHQDEKKNLLIEILMQNKIHRTLEISTCDFLHYEQCFYTNEIITELIVHSANNIDILNVIFNSKKTKLQRLKLNHSLISTSIANYFCRLVKTNLTLIELDLLDATHFDDKDFLENLFHTVEQHQSIKQLRLHISKIKSTDEKETLLIHCLENNQFLTHLCLSQSIVSSQLIQKLIDTIKTHRSLIHLEFYQCNLNENYIEQLQILENQGYLFYLVISQQSRYFPKSKRESNLKWKQHAMTIVGGKGYGNESNQLNHPEGVYIDDEQKAFYVGDRSNHRIMKWKFSTNNGQVVAGGNGKGDRIDQLSHPTDVIVDKKTKSLIICDKGNRRVVRWSMENPQDQQILISDIDCSGLIMNDNGDLFVSDWERHEVKRWRKGERKGTVVAGGNGKGDRLNQLNCPTYIFIDRNDAVYVSDRRNHRVMKWVKDAKEGVVVAGGQGKGNGFKQLSFPEGMSVNDVSDVYVADSWNNRIMFWPSGSKEGCLVAGGNGKGQQSNQLNYPQGLSFDNENNLYVADQWNDRIQRFDVDEN